ncbi:MAG: nucleotidyltransferase family protein [Oscillospiraceae bacterium]|nr:nucleotidyltransferase family protein [Oscillospiraceae bacterium]
MNITAIILAAGQSRRMDGTQKLLLPIGGRPMLQHTLDLVASLPFSRTILVTVPEVAQQIQTTAEILINSAPEAGQSSSVRLGVQAAPPDTGLFFLPGDQSLLDMATIQAIFSADNGTSIVYPITTDGTPKSPVLFAPRFREALLALQGDEGGRQIRQQYPTACRGVQVPNEQALWDVDTPTEYEEILTHWEGHP